MIRNRVLVLSPIFPTLVNEDATPPFVYELSKKLTTQFDIVILASYSHETKMLQGKYFIQNHGVKQLPHVKLKKLQPESPTNIFILKK